MSKTGTRKSYHEQLQDLIIEYRQLHGDQFTIEDVAEWAFSNERHDIVRSSAKKELKRNLAKAAAKKKIKDSQGRRVREYHSAKYPKVDANGQMLMESIWDHIQSMSYDHAALSFIVGRRGQLAGGCKSLKHDSASFNDNNPNASEDKIQINFDFTFDVDDPEDSTESVDPKRPR